MAKITKLYYRKTSQLMQLL